MAEPVKQEVQAEEVVPTSFTVVLKSAGESKVNTIKVVRAVTGLGLKESKELVDGAPSTIMENLNKEDTEILCAKFTAEGAITEIKAV